MNDDFPKVFDLVVVGTGLTESIVAAGASRIGKSVLHLDNNAYYGGYWASFGLEAIQTYAKEAVCGPGKNVLFSGENLKIIEGNCHVRDVDSKWLIPETADEGDDSAWCISKLRKQMRQFNIDLWPTLLYSAGSMVKLLISSNICRYAEFRATDRVATMFEGQVKTVPCSRSDVFVSTEVNMVEKRKLMKLIETCEGFADGQEEYEQLKAGTFSAFLVSKGIQCNGKLHSYLINALSMSTEETSFLDGVQSLNRFVHSLGRYGNTPFLYPMYGCGEIPQCFCRLCAVFGGIYCLQRGITNIKKKTDTLEVTLASEDTIDVKDIVFGADTISIEDGEQRQRANIVRAVLISDKPLDDTNTNPKGGGVEFLRLRHEKGEAYLIQLSHYSGCCPKELFLYHFTSKSETDDSPRSHLKPYIDQVFKETDKILFELFFTIPDTRNAIQISDGLHLAGGPSFELDFDRSIEEAKELFTKMYPGEEFLPRAPEPEEIVLDGYDDQPDKEDSKSDDHIENKPESEVNDKPKDHLEDKTEGIPEN